MSLLDHHSTYRPQNYPWAMTAWETQQKIHWLASEIPMADDVKDWNVLMTPQEKNLATQILRFFTQSDCEVLSNYNTRYAQVFKPTEIVMMLTAFANAETIHVQAYAHLLDTVGMPEAEFSAFLQYKEMKDKWEFLQTFDVSTKHNIAKTLAAFGGFIEGLQLFASFAILLNFPRHGKLKGAGQIVTWSVRDETLHCDSIIKLFGTFVSENPKVWTRRLRDEIYETCATIVDHEDAFIDLAFEQGGVEGLTADEVKRYIRFIADRRLTQLGTAIPHELRQKAGLNEVYGIEKNPLPWIDEMLNAVEHANFFEARATEYSRASTEGTWEEAFS